MADQNYFIQRAAENLSGPQTQGNVSSSKARQGKGNGIGAQVKGVKNPSQNRSHGTRRASSVSRIDAPREGNRNLERSWSMCTKASMNNLFRGKMACDINVML